MPVQPLTSLLLEHKLLEAEALSVLLAAEPATERRWSKPGPGSLRVCACVGTRAPPVLWTWVAHSRDMGDPLPALCPGDTAINGQVSFGIHAAKRDVYVPNPLPSEPTTFVPSEEPPPMAP